MGWEIGREHRAHAQVRARSPRLRHGTESALSRERNFGCSDLKLCEHCPDSTNKIADPSELALATINASCSAVSAANVVTWISAASDFAFAAARTLPSVSYEPLKECFAKLTSVVCSECRKQVLTATVTRRRVCPFPLSLSASLCGGLFPRRPSGQMRESTRLAGGAIRSGKFRSLAK